MSDLLCIGADNRDRSLERGKIMAEYLTPGVYVEEVDRGIRIMEGVSTSRTGFIGLTQRGPIVGKPTLITSFAEYLRIFGGFLPNSFKEHRYLAYSVEQFFENGGNAAYIMRVANPKDTCAFHNIEGVIPIHVESANVGKWGNQLQLKITRNYKRKVTILEEGSAECSYIVRDASAFCVGDLVEFSDGEKAGSFYKVLSIQDQCITLDAPLEKENASLTENKLYAVQYDIWVEISDLEESYIGVSMQQGLSNSWDIIVAKSQFIKVTLDQKDADKAAYQELDQRLCADNGVYQMTFTQGTTNNVEDELSMYRGEDHGLGKRSGLYAFQEVTDVSLMCMPGITSLQVQSALIAYCENRKNCFAILDMPFSAKTAAELLEHRSHFDSSYAAMYHPWLECFDRLEKCSVFFPPSGFIAGIYARTDNTRGVHKAPANESVQNCTRLSVNYQETEQAKLNPQGINLIRAIPGSGIRVWGARTLSSDSSWKYVNIRRLFIYIEETIRLNIQWAVNEPNDELLWERVQKKIIMFLTTIWRNGALMGATPNEAFFVDVGKTTMTQEDILHGHLICLVGVAPTRPAEFVIFKITLELEAGA